MPNSLTPSEISKGWYNFCGAVEHGQCYDWQEGNRYSNMAKIFAKNLWWSPVLTPARLYLRYQRPIDRAASAVSYNTRYYSHLIGGKVAGSQSSLDQAVEIAAKEGDLYDTKLALFAGGKPHDDLATDLAGKPNHRGESFSKLQAVVEHGGNVKGRYCTAADLLVERYKWTGGLEKEQLEALKTVIKDGGLKAQDLEPCIAKRALENQFWSGFLYLTNELGVKTYLNQECRQNWYIKHVPEDHPQRDIVIQAIKDLPEPDEHHSHSVVR